MGGCVSFRAHSRHLSKYSKYPVPSGYQWGHGCLHTYQTRSARDRPKCRTLNWNTCPWKANFKKSDCYGACGTWKLVLHWSTALVMWLGQHLLHLAYKKWRNAPFPSHLFKRRERTSWDRATTFFVSDQWGLQSQKSWGICSLDSCDVAIRTHRVDKGHSGAHQESEGVAICLMLVQSRWAPCRCWNWVWL